MIEIKNLPMNHDKYVIAVAVYCEREDIEPEIEWWYFGSFDNETKAYKVALGVSRAQVFVRG